MKRGVALSREKVMDNIEHIGEGFPKLYGIHAEIYRREEEGEDQEDVVCLGYRFTHKGDDICMYMPYESDKGTLTLISNNWTIQKNDKLFGSSDFRTIGNVMDFLGIGRID